ncbi:hypothetical protein SAMN04488243_1393 [Thermus arciformis]|uniref:Uncharacterized protein n=1 Tax=Thermus arciformis TaxID=482827 RepID=A0A1G7JX61_9DEIN|nr:hypothetical protein [Thermus arciformis]SDF29558.1 hypothetical protein SAMN04488243_1393 [Thermus arciformis]
MKANPTLIHVAQLLVGRCPRRLLQGLLRRVERAKGPGPGEELGEAHHWEVDRLLALYRERGYWARARLELCFPQAVVRAQLDGLLLGRARRWGSSGWERRTPRGAPSMP